APPASVAASTPPKGRIEPSGSGLPPSTEVSALSGSNFAGSQGIAWTVSNTTAPGTAGSLSAQLVLAAGTLPAQPSSALDSDGIAAERLLSTSGARRPIVLVGILGSGRAPRAQPSPA